MYLDYAYFLKLQECVKPLVNCELNTRQFNEKLITLTNNEFPEFGVFSTDENVGRSFSGSVWNEHRDKFSGLVFQRGAFKHTLVSRFNSLPFIIRGYPEATDIEEFNFSPDYEAHYFPKYDGVLISTFILPNGVFSGKTKEIEYLDRNGGANVNFSKILNDIGVSKKLEAISKRHDCVVHGILVGKELSGIDIEEYEYIALDITDAKNHIFYPKESSNSVFTEYGLTSEKEINLDQTDETIEQYGGVIVKFYINGELHLFTKESKDISESVRERRVFRDSYASSSDFCWKNPNYDSRIQTALNRHKVSQSVNWVKERIQRFELSESGKRKIKNYLLGHYYAISNMSVEEIYEHLKWKWEWSNLDKPELIIPILEEWKDEIKNKSDYEIESLTAVRHFDSIFL
jgi:hypothetical protein